MAEDMQGVQESGGTDTMQSHDALKRTKIINDPIHGSIEVNHLCMMIIDTPQFQRLRHIKQLGGCYYVYPGSTHNRFEHSLGVYHLAGEFARILQINHPDRGITKEDVLCVEIAGLCHDLGHGPFSHVFENRFLAKVSPPVIWTHEEASVKMFEFLLEKNPRVKEEMDRQLPDRRYLTFINEMMNPPTYDGENYPFSGQSAEKQFLYEIVSNSRNEIDVDKWDYFARDCHMLGIKNNFEHIRYMKFARIIYVDRVPKGELPGWQICMRDKEANNLYDMFHTRMALYRRAYFHKDTRGVELMIADAFLLADEFVEDLGIRGFSSPDVPRRISHCQDDMEAYLHLTDSLYYLIMYSQLENEKMKKAKQLLQRIQNRALYKCVAQASQRNGPELLQPEDEKKIQRAVITANADREQRLSEDDIAVCILNFNYGKKHKNPMESVRFYRKSDQTKADFLLKDEISHMLPYVFEERVVSIYCKNPEDQEKCELTANYFKRWCDVSTDPAMEKPKIWLAPRGGAQSV